MDENRFWAEGQAAAEKWAAGGKKTPEELKEHAEKYARELYLKQFVPKYYQMNPKTEDLLPNGRRLMDGMVVLIANNDYRVEIATFEKKIGVPCADTENSRKWNRWATVTEFDIKNEGGFENISFIAVYGDGTKAQIIQSSISAWYVKLDSIPPVDVEWEDIDDGDDVDDDLTINIGSTTSEQRRKAHESRAEADQDLIKKVQALKNNGESNVTIANVLGVTESRVRAFLNRTKKSDAEGTIIANPDGWVGR